ncbi:heavy metal transporter [Streptomyces marispadix]|uniref:Heavy metal transporter n=1 Tax=Streptomyces marispadix TaxID=2922868 RepID=A0ABS9T1N3_9ACTN|nr:heavy metal transporter [Streptomyces marispadix]MCH6162388.1 heavy metal transporter [Streptomyces marispadix]
MSPAESAHPKSRKRALRLAAACTVLLVVAGYAVTQYATSSQGPARCTVETPGEKPERYEIRPEQAANAATITAVASQRDLPERAVTIALATAMQESALRNIEHGDRDSLGLFQQRPSQGWGSERQIQDPVYSSGKFYDHLVEIPGYSRLPLTVAAQRVQRSGYPQAYAKHEQNAALLTAALTGRRAAALNCTTGPAGGDGKAGSAERLRARLVREFGDGVLPGQRRDEAAGAAAPSGRNVSLDEVPERRGDGPDETGTHGRKSAAHAPHAAAAEGDDASRVRIPVRRGQRGWELAHWAVANAQDLHIEQISYLDRVWDASSSEEGWRPRENSGGADGERAVSVRLAKGT